MFRLGLQVAGVDLDGLIRETKGEGWTPDQPVVDYTADRDRITVYIEKA